MTDTLAAPGHESESTMTAETPTVETTQDRRRKAAKISLAAIALLGIGAAATSAAWSDDVWFGGTANAGTFEVQGSLDGTTWTDADDEATSIAIPDSELEGLVPGETRTVTLYLKNASDVTATLAPDAAVTTAGDVFAGSNPALVDVETIADPELDADEETSVDLTVTTPENWGDTYQGTDGTIVVTFQAQS
ncbi:putative ribosomally synthesized peptide with SipW-like signal peptide [Sediminihabitans luteus]|uniref:Putative ribosomally synthesized peptide with SipW-like signal peptide n=1 Tax=Sediminihabitans luteus TaxID=1138585 RepID=A0A2M9CCZ0_9CELL|nr:SipW-dependent-type signal peptide-containing protein [Sediminihabitans luteus]PJJ69209.1 putative ribosomally synthesized peptide with SipW-like signal peptide [Sediminihabitans luteus]GII98884.1 hypothetical protein Slu03_12620 [Sediminihabitans luteus]